MVHLSLPGLTPAFYSILHYNTFALVMPTLVDMKMWGKLTLHTFNPQLILNNEAVEKEAGKSLPFLL